MMPERDSHENNKRPSKGTNDGTKWTTCQVNNLMLNMGPVEAGTLKCSHPGHEELRQSSSIALRMSHNL